MTHLLEDLGTKPVMTLTAICDEFFQQWEDGVHGILLMRPTSGDPKLDRRLESTEWKPWFVVGLDGDSAPGARFTNEMMEELAETGFLTELRSSKLAKETPLYLKALRVMDEMRQAEEIDEDDDQLEEEPAEAVTGAANDWRFLVPTDKALSIYAEIRKGFGDGRPSQILGSIMRHLH